jgi:hypothetical protein
MKKINTLLIIVFAYGLFMGCMTNRTAIMKVLTNPNSFDSVGKVYEGLHPCSNDTILKGSDTIVNHDTVTNSFYFCDTIHHVKIDSVVKNYFTTKTIHDTLIVKDKQLIEQLQQIKAEKQAIAAVNDNTQSNNNKLTNKADLWRIIAILLAIMLFLCTGLLIYKSLKIC